MSRRFMSMVPAVLACGLLVASSLGAREAVPSVGTQGIGHQIDPNGLTQGVGFNIDPGGLALGQVSTSSPLDPPRGAPEGLDIEPIGLPGLLWADTDAPRHSIDVSVDFFMESPPPPGSITLELFQRREEAPDRSAEIHVDAAGPHRLEVGGSGTWRLRCVSDEYWCPESDVDVQAEASYYVPIFPAVTVTGTARLPERTDSPAALSVQGWLRLAKEKNPSISWAQEVPIADNESFRFQAPKGILDFRIAGGNWVPHYVWGFDTTAREGRLDELEFEQGSSLSGFVWDASTDLPAQGAAVRVMAAGSDDSAVRDSRADQVVFKARVNDRGFFQVGGLPQGVYNLRVSAEGRAPQIFGPVEVLEDSELALSGKISLLPLFRAEIHVDPPVPPGGERWTVSLRGRVQEVDHKWNTEAETDENGTAILTGLIPQNYGVEIFDESGSRLFVKEESLERDEVLYYELDVVELHGTITLNDEPLKATIVIMTGSDSDQSSFESDSETGEFSGLLHTPEWKILMVQVKAEEPKFSRSLVIEDPEVRKKRLELELELVGIDVSGVVVDAAGKPVDNARVGASLARLRGTSTRSGSDGEFTLNALEEGRWKLHASTTRADSEFVSFALEEGRPPPFQRLVLQERREIRGVLRAADGRPVPNARVWSMAVGPHPSIDKRTESDLDGNFHVLLGAEATHAVFQVLAPSQVLWSGCVALPRDMDELTLTLPPLPGGHLEIRWVGEREGPPDTGREVYLVTSDGGFLSGNEVFGWRFLVDRKTSVGDAAGQWLLARLAAGRRYAVLRTAEPWWTLAARLCLAGPPPELDWVYLPEGGSEQIVIDVNDP